MPTTAGVIITYLGLIRSVPNIKWSVQNHHYKTNVNNERNFSCHCQCRRLKAKRTQWLSMLTCDEKTRRRAFLPRDAMLARNMLSSCVCLSDRLSVCHKPVLYRNDWTNRAGFWDGGFFQHYPTLCYRETRESPKEGYFSWTKKILPRQVDRVVNKTGRRSSLRPHL